VIGVFDSGIGGLTVVRALLEHLPGQNIIYLGDTARTPYGSKSSDTIVKYCLNNTEFLIRHGAHIIVIACNTASSYAYDAVRSTFDVPVFEVIGPGSELAVQRSRSQRIGVIGTRATVASGIYEKRIRAIAPEAKVFMVPCPLLVPLVEEGWLRRPETAMIVRKYLAGLKTKQIDTLILGCTHYPVLRDLIQYKIGFRVKLVDSAEAIARQVSQYLESEDNASFSPISSQDQCRIYVTDTAEQFQKTAHFLLKKKVPVEHADI
jgi:glutamate racemase